MPQTALTPVTCPSCRRPFTAQLEQIFDVGQDPQAKARLLSGRFNLVTCPHCGFRGTMAVPIVYHDPTKELLLVYIPMELNLREAERQRLIGDLTNRILTALPPEQRKSYLLQPRQSLSLQGLIESVLQAEGVTPEMLAEQKAQLQLVTRLLQSAASDEASFAAMVRENDDKFNYTFFELLTASAEAAEAEGRPNAAAQLRALRERLLPLTTFGKQVQQQQAAIEKLEQAIQEAGGLTADLLLDQLLAAQDDTILQALVAASRPALDYSFFLALADRVDQAEAAGQAAEAARLKARRERILTLVEALDQQSRAVLEDAAGTLREILNSPDPRQAVRAHLGELDDAFMAVLEANLRAAESAGQTEAMRRLEEIGDLVMQELQAIAPPEIQLTNALLAAPDEAATRRILDEHRREITPQFVAFIGQLAESLRRSGRIETANRLQQLQSLLTAEGYPAGTHAPAP